MNDLEAIKICKQVAADVENDAKEFDGKIFNGKNVAEYFGNHGAAINALAKVLEHILENKNTSINETKRMR